MYETKDISEILMMYNVDDISKLNTYKFKSEDEIKSYIVQMINDNMLVKNENIVYQMDLDKFISLSIASDDITIFKLAESDEFLLIIE